MQPYLYSTAQPSSVPALAIHEPATPMPSDMMFNPVTDNFTNIQPTQPTPAPVSVSHTLTCTSFTFLSLHYFRFFVTGCQH